MQSIHLPAPGPQRRRGHALAATLAGAALALFLSAPAAAYVFCVSNGTQLQNALTDASDGGMHDGEDNFIYLQTGTFNTGAATGNGPFHYHGSSDRHIDIFGGYNADCSSQTRDARLSVLDGQHATQVLNVRSASGPIDLFNFTVRNGESTSAGGGLSVNSVAGDNASVGIVNLIIRDNHSTLSAGGVFAATGAGNDLYVGGNLVVGNSADTGNGAGNLLANGAAAGVANNTITQNGTALANGAGGLRVSGATGCNCSVSNNIIWANDNAGLYLGNSNVHIAYNDIGTLDGAAPSSTAGGISSAPHFVDAANGDFHLRGDSPCIALSPQISGTYDIEGHHWAAFNSRTDIGAYYETIFIDGFD